MAATDVAPAAEAEQLMMDLLGLPRDELRTKCRSEGLRVSVTKRELSKRLALHMTALGDGAPSSAPAEPTAQAIAPAPSPLPPELAVARPSPEPAVAISEPAAVAIPAAVAPVARPALPTRNGRKAPPPSRDPPTAAAADAPSEDSSHTASGADMEIVILGSGACSPSPIRSASSLALRLRDRHWLFDVGEGTQVQLQKCSVGPSRIDRIFVTHSHGDHCFGLPGLLCLIARDRDRDAPPMEIYGPTGLRAFLRVTLRFSGTSFLPRYVVHELHSIPFLHSRRPQPAPLIVPGGDAQPSEAGEQPGGRDIQPDPDGTWSLLRTPYGDDGGYLTVRAAPLRHTAPTVGYVVTEDDKPGRLLPEVVMPLLLRNSARLREEWGVRNPNSLLKTIKALGVGESLTLPDGTVIRQSDALGGVRRGRKVAVLGDCCDASLCAGIAQGADILVHEATNAYLPKYGDRGGANALERDTFTRGHSTPQMAGAAAKAFGAKALLLNHFSQRYSPDALGVMRAIQRAAAAQSGLPEDRVITARDTLVVPVWQEDRAKPLQPFLHTGWQRMADDHPGGREAM
jgi:ribonuclease Z